MKELLERLNIEEGEKVAIVVPSLSAEEVAGVLELVDSGLLAFVEFWFDKEALRMQSLGRDDSCHARLIGKRGTAKLSDHSMRAVVLQNQGTVTYFKGDSYYTLPNANEFYASLTKESVDAPSYNEGTAITVGRNRNLLDSLEELARKYPNEPITVCTNNISRTQVFHLKRLSEGRAAPTTLVIGDSILSLSAYSAIKALSLEGPVADGAHLIPYLSVGSISLIGADCKTDSDAIAMVTQREAPYYFPYDGAQEPYTNEASVEYAKEAYKRYTSLSAQSKEDSKVWIPTVGEWSDIANELGPMPLVTQTNEKGLTPQRKKEIKLEIIRRKARVKLSVYAKLAWKELNPGTDLVWGWHLDALCDHLTAISDGVFNTMLINIPPGHSKTTIASVIWPTWHWGNEPESRWIFAGYATNNINRDQRQRRMLIQSTLYKEIFEPDWEIGYGGNQITMFENTRMGMMRGTSVNSENITGAHGDYQVIDDPIPGHAVAGPEADICREWWNGTMSTRFRSMANRKAVLIGQRVREGDLSDVWLEQEFVDAHLKLPVMYDPEKALPPTPIGWVDPRTEKDELLFPARYNHEDVEKMKRSLGSYCFAAQYQQSPESIEDGVIKRSAWRYYDALPMDAAKGEWFGAVDSAVDAGESHDYTVAMVFVRVGQYVWLVDIISGKWSFTDQLAQLEAFCKKYPQCKQWIVEKRANGAAILSSLKSKIPTLIPYNSQTPKEERIITITPMIESGNILIPRQHPLTERLVSESTTFPKGKHDDHLDCMSMAIIPQLPKLRQTFKLGAEAGQRTGASTSSMQKPSRFNRR